MLTRKRRWSILIAAALLGLLICGFAAFQYAIHSLKEQVEKTLGPQGEVNEIRISLTGVEIIGLRIKAQAATKETDWPADDQLRANRILVVPSFADLFAGKMVVDTLRIEGAYITMLRTSNGQVKVLPGMLERQAASTGNVSTEEKESPALAIDRIELVNGTIEFFDATLRNSPHKLRLEQIDAGVERLRLPSLKGISKFDLVGVLKGARHDGKISISGTVEFATKESGITTRLRDVDLITLQPYLFKATESGVKKGTLDLDLNSSVRKGILHAPGTLTLKDLELASTAGTLMGIPRNAVIGMMKNRDGKITLRFILEGNINDPRFSLNENLARMLGSSMADSLGVSVGGLARGVGLRGGNASKGIGESVGRLIHK